MITDSSILVVVKLGSGETILATMVDQTDNSITIEYPLEMKWSPYETPAGLVGYKLTAMTYCPFTVDRTFVLRITDVQHINGMNETLVESYLSLVMDKSNKSPSVNNEPEGVTPIDTGRVVH
jgi:hypothetical protein